MHMKLFAPPYPNDDAFFCRFFTEVSSLRDAAGRPLHEVDFREGGEAYSTCPFHDSRRGYLMNKAALMQIAGEWSEIVEGVRFFTSLFEGGGQRDFSRAWRISLAAMFAPLYLVHRSKRPFADGTLPTAVSGVFKIMLDVPTTMDLMLMKGWNDAIANSVHQDHPRQIQEFADSNLILLNGDYACAGSPGLIQNIVTILFEGHRRSDSKLGVVSECFGEPQEFLAFCYFMSSQYVVGLLYLLSTMISMERAFATFAEGSVAAEEGRMSAYERRRRIALDVLDGPVNCEGIFRQLSELVQDESRWGLPSAYRLDTIAVLDESIAFRQRIERATAQEIAKAHGDYQNVIESTLSGIQNEIVTLIGAKEMFASRIRFGDPQLHPAQILKGRLSKRLQN